MKFQSSKLESDKYHVIRELGRGGMGVVYLSEDQLLKRNVALKVLYDHLNRESSFVEQFQEEARSVSTLHHPNIVCVHGLEQTNGVVAIDMEYVDGQSLDVLIAEANVTPHIAVAIARDVLSGLAACHDLGVVHRDIKPSNILISKDGTAKITDFGLATAYATHLEATVQGNTSSGFYMGTPRYMPMDAWEGGEPNPNWDLYSFGVVFYELLSGRVAFEGDNPIAIMKKHLTDPLPSLRKVTQGLSVELTDLVDLLVQPPGEGYPLSSPEALAALQKTPEFQVLQDSNSDVTIAVPRRRIFRLTKRHKERTRQLITAAMALTLCIVIAWHFVTTTVDGETQTIPDRVQTSLHGQVMSMSVVGPVGEEETWFVEKGAQRDSLILCGFSSFGMIRLIGQKESSGDWTLSGGWAESVLPQAGSIQYGTAHGSLHWPDPQSGMHIQLEKIRERDNLKTSQTLAGHPTASEHTRERFLRDLESSELRQNLLYTEILPRRQDWAIALEAMLPARSKSRYSIPYATGVINNDGVLDEALWTDDFYRVDGGGRIGDLAPHRPKIGPTLRVRWNRGAVLLATELETTAKDVQLSIAILPAFEISLQNSARFLLHIDAIGKQQLRYYHGTVERPGDFSWLVTSADEDGIRTIELEIPTEVLDAEAQPVAGKRWRVNVHWFRENSSGEREILAQWGDEDIMALEHGALFVFNGGKTPE